jgi:ATP-dependent Clp protease ATP-binding subunit ClpC
MNEDDFWEKKMKKREVIEKYKMLEVTVSIEERLASPIIKLKEACDSESDLGLSSYNSIIEKAADSLYSWEERLAESMGSTVWMIISGFDNPAEDNSWIVQLMNFEKRWCRRLNLYSTVAAFSTKDEQLIKIILEVNGPGAYTYLSMEQGLHRRLNQNRKNERAQIEIMKRTILPDIENIKVKQVKKKNSLLKMDVSYSYKMENRKLGIQFDLLSSNPDVLKNIVYDLKKKDKQGPEAEVARVYGENGLVKDPRTGISMQDNKQLWKGNLDDFLDAWMATINVKE